MEELLRGCCLYGEITRLLVLLGVLAKEKGLLAVEALRHVAVRRRLVISVDMRANVKPQKEGGSDAVETTVEEGQQLRLRFRLLRSIWPA